MKDRIVRLALIGLIAGVVVGEFFPDLFKDSAGQFAESFSRAFDGHRNHLAMRYGVIGAAIGALAGYLSRNKRG
jgi:hypothetical protein